MTTNDVISELDIVAYVDNELDENRVQEVETWLATHPEDAAKVHAYKLQNILLGSLHTDLLTAPIPAYVQSTMTQERSRLIDISWVRIAAAIFLVLAGSVAGWEVNRLQASNEGAQQQFIQQALKAHVVFVSGGPGVRETAVLSNDQLTGVYARYFNHPIKVPDLAGAGFRATGRRLVNSNGVPTAQFMYKDTSGRMVTLYVQSGFDLTDMTFRLLAENDMVAFYWSDGPLAYALTGSMERGDLLDLARMVYEKLPGQRKLSHKTDSNFTQRPNS